MERGTGRDSQLCVIPVFLEQEGVSVQAGESWFAFPRCPAPPGVLLKPNFSGNHTG